MIGAPRPGEALRATRGLRGAGANALAALRPRQWAHFTLLPLAGLDLALPLPTAAAALARGVAIAALILGYGYLVNALSDRELDRDPTKNPLVAFGGSTAAHWALAAALAAGALGLAATGPGPALAATAVALACGAVYSIGPRLKGWPGICTLLNVGCFAPLLFVGLAEAPVGPARWALAAAFAGLLLQNQLVHEAADAAEDRAGGLRTTFLVAGPRGTAVAALVAGVAVFTAAGWLLVARGAPPSLAALALPYAIWIPAALARRGAEPARMTALRRHHRLAAAATGAALFAVLVTPA